MKNAPGFTLIELMVTVAIVSILGAIALPAYQESVRKSRRAEAKAFVMEAAAREQRFFSNYNQYTNIVVAPGGCSGAACGLGYSSANSENAYYQIAATATGTAPTTFSLTATALSGTTQFKDTGCRSLSIDQAGNKTAKNSAGTAVTANTCW